MGETGRETIKTIIQEYYDLRRSDSEDEAFLIASEAAMGGGSWDYRVEKEEEE